MLKNNVAVLLSTYNGEKYLKEQIDSVLNQKNANVTLVIRDDGSKDTTKDIIKKYNSDKIKLIEGNNLGYAKSFWELMKSVKNYDYYAFCDQDDIWMDDKLFSAIKMLKEYDDIPALYTSSVVSVNNDMEIIDENTFNNTRTLSVYESFQKSKFPGCVFVFNNKAKIILEKYNGFMESHDWAAYSIISVFGKTVYDSNSHIKYRIHDNNAIGKQSVMKSFLKKGKRFFCKSKCVRSRFAKDFYETYENSIPEKYKNDIYQLAFYKSSFMNTVKLVKNKNFAGIIFKIYVLMNKV